MFPELKKNFKNLKSLLLLILDCQTVNLTMKKITSNDVRSLLNAMEDLIDIKLIMRSIVPNYELGDAEKERFIKALKSLHDKLIPVFAKYLELEVPKSKKLSRIDSISNLRQLIDQNTIILDSATSSKKKLKGAGMYARNIIVSGGPLTMKNYTKVNPNIPEKALEGIEKKCERLKNELRTELQNDKTIVFVHENNNETDDIILEELDEISLKIGKKVKDYEIESWQSLET